MQIHTPQAHTKENSGKEKWMRNYEMSLDQPLELQREALQRKTGMTKDRILDQRGSPWPKLEHQNKQK